ncbi:MAG: ASCH domain-containing protein, partial [Actinobacteria bacterium]|nr:ASCH domain-containing protein [Actinomycetota bacterium]
MGSPAVGRVALMSIHPEYADAILAGTKKVEFRKRPIADDVTHVIVYATAPVSAIVGAFTVENQATAAPSNLWRRFAKVGGITRHGFFSYFADRTQAIRYGEILQLNDVSVGFHPAGHVLGSAQIAMTCNGLRIVASGDYKDAPD